MMGERLEGKLRLRFRGGRLFELGSLNGERPLIVDCFSLTVDCCKRPPLLRGGKLWLGELHLVAIYSKALTAAEVSQNYTATATQPTPTATVIPTATETPTPLPTATPPPPPADPPPDPIVIQRVTYAIAGQPIAMRVSGDPVAANNGLHYLYSDHLGSNSAMQAPDGTITHTRYEPFGAYRGGSGGNAITDRGFTGHKQNDSLGLIYMNARFYVPGIGRFASADTIVPDPENPQSLNRYAYVENSPLAYFDPSGHCVEAYANTDQDTLSYCIDSVTRLADHLANNYEEDFTKFIQWMMMNGDIDFVLSYSEQVGLTSAEDRPIPVGGKHLAGCTSLHSGMSMCPPEEGWSEYYPGTEEFVRDLGKNIAITGLLLPLGSIVGKLLPKATFIQRFLVTSGLKKLITPIFENNADNNIHDNHSEGNASSLSLIVDQTYIIDNITSGTNNAYLHIQGDR